jgi:DNA polymerase delta subunit 1
MNNKKRKHSEGDTPLRKKMMLQETSKGIIPTKMTLDFDIPSHWGRPEWIIPNSGRERFPGDWKNTFPLDITFQMVDIDYEIQGKWNYKGSDPVTVIRIYGTTLKGNSVCCRVVGFRPYMYLECNQKKLPSTAQVHEDIERRLKEKFMVQKEGMKKYGADWDTYTYWQPQKGQYWRARHRYVESVRLVKRTNLYGYHGEQYYLKVSFFSPREIPTVRDALWKGEWGPAYPKQTYECDFLFVLRFMVDKGIVGGGWVKVRVDQKAIIKDTQKQSSCQIEVQVVPDSIEGIAPVGKWNISAPLRIVSFDIECAGRRGHFPDPEIDPVIQIANFGVIHGEQPVSGSAFKTAPPFVYNIFQWKDCAAVESDPPGAQTLVFETEMEMLLGWKKFIDVVDPDMLSGYNIIDFDIFFLLKRAEALGIGDMFSSLSRLKERACKIREGNFSSKAYGNRKRKEIDMPGRIQFDLLPIMRRDYKLRSYSLNSVATKFLGAQKTVFYFLNCAFFHMLPLAFRVLHRPKSSNFCNASNATR